MSNIIKKGSSFSASYASPDFPVLDGDWTATMELYTAYPGTPEITKAMTLADNKFSFTLSIAEVDALDVGLYTLFTRMTNAVLGITIEQIEYVTVADVSGFVQVGLTRMYLSLANPDGSPAADTNIQVAHEQVVNVDGNIVGSSNFTVKTNTAGYAEFYVVQGLLTKVTCSDFGSLTINTKGKTSIDVSTYFTK